MRERPILFQDAMVRAILSGQKTQTRRLVKPEIALHMPASANCGSKQPFRCPYGQPGDRLWVRECWAPIGMTELFTSKQRTAYEFRAGRLVLKQGQEPAVIEQKPFFHVDRWYPSIHMPRAACRLVLEIVSVRIERLQDICEADAIAEGIQWSAPMQGYHVEDGAYFHAASAVESYRFLWEAINGAESWGANPWVWVVEFQRVQA